MSCGIWHFSACNYQFCRYRAPSHRCFHLFCLIRCFLLARWLQITCTTNCQLLSFVEQFTLWQSRIKKKQHHLDAATTLIFKTAWILPPPFWTCNTFRVNTVKTVCIWSVAQILKGWTLHKTYCANVVLLTFWSHKCFSDLALLCGLWWSNAIPHTFIHQYSSDFLKM